MRVVYEAPLTEVVPIRPEGMIAVSDPLITTPFEGEEDWYV